MHLETLECSSTAFFVSFVSTNVCFEHWVSLFLRTLLFLWVSLNWRLVQGCLALPHVGREFCLHQLFIRLYSLNNLLSGCPPALWMLFSSIQCFVNPLYAIPEHLLVTSSSPIGKLSAVFLFVCLQGVKVILIWPFLTTYALPAMKLPNNRKQPRFFALTSPIASQWSRPQANDGSYLCTNKLAIKWLACFPAIF